MSLQGCCRNSICTRGLHIRRDLQICTGFHKGLAQARTRADTIAKTCTRGLHNRTPLYKGLHKGLHQGLAHLHKRLQPGEATERHLRWVKTLSGQYFKARMGFTAQLASAPMRLRGYAGHYCKGVINYHKAVPEKVWLCERPGVVLNGLFTANRHPRIFFETMQSWSRSMVLL